MSRAPKNVESTLVTPLCDERARQAALSRLDDQVEHQAVVTLVHGTTRVPVDFNSDGGAA